MGDTITIVLVESKQPISRYICSGRVSLENMSIRGSNETYQYIKRDIISISGISIESKRHYQ